MRCLSPVAAEEMMKQNDDDEFLPTEAIFAAGFLAARRRMFTTQEIADKWQYTYHGADSMLRKASRTTWISREERGGVWYTTDEWATQAEKAMALAKALRQQVHEDRVPEKRDLVMLLNALHVLLRDFA